MSFRPAEAAEQTKNDEGKVKFVMLGIGLIATGFVSHALVVFTANLKLEGMDWDERQMEYLVSLPWLIVGFFCLRARSKATNVTRYLLFFLALVLIGCGIGYIAGYKVQQIRVCVKVDKRVFSASLNTPLGICSCASVNALGSFQRATGKATTLSKIQIEMSKLIKIRHNTTNVLLGSKLVLSSK